MMMQQSGTLHTLPIKALFSNFLRRFRPTVQSFENSDSMKSVMFSLLNPRISMNRSICIIYIKLLSDSEVEFRYKAIAN